MISYQSPRGGGTDLERGYGDVRPWRPPFHTSPVARKGPISSKRVSSQDPLLRKFDNFSLNSLNFYPNFSSQAPKFGNFQLTSPQIWKFSAQQPQIWKFSSHKPPNLEIFRSQAPLFRGKCQFASPTLRKSGPHTPTWKKVECPPPPDQAKLQFVKKVFQIKLRNINFHIKKKKTQYNSWHEMEYIFLFWLFSDMGVALNLWQFLSSTRL